MFRFSLMGEQISFCWWKHKQNKWGICWRLIKTYEAVVAATEATGSILLLLLSAFFNFPTTTNTTNNCEMEWMMELKHESGRWLLTPVEAKIRSLWSSQSCWSLIICSTEMFPKMFQKNAKMLPSFNTNKIGNSNAVQFESNLKQFT